MDPTTPRQRYLRRYDALKGERSSWVTHWRDLSDQIYPRRSRFLGEQPNRSTRNEKIINNTPRRAQRILASGMMAGLTSPSRPWFKLTTPDPDLGEFGPVKEWLHQVEERLRLGMQKSNIYNCLAMSFGMLPVFGVSATHIEEDLEDGFRGYVYPIGSYCLAASDRGQVDTVYRELSMTVGQLVAKFGRERCSPRVRELYDRHDLDTWIQVLHVIEPNRDRKLRDGSMEREYPILPFKSMRSLWSAGPAGMKWRSCWMELAGDEQTGFLRESGYEEMPTLCPRWEVNGEDVYGYAPGMDALGDSMALQRAEKRKAQAFDKIVNPPMGGPEGLLHTRASLLPGEYTGIPLALSGAKVYPLVEIHPQTLPAANETIKAHEARIESTFYADLWLMFSQITSDMTAREVAERHEEKMLQLGPVLERLHDEKLDPLIDRLFGIELRAGRLPPPPEELEGVDLKVEHISIVAQAQKLIGLTGIEKLAGFVGSVAQLRPDILDTVDADKFVRSYAEYVGTPPDLLLDPEEVAAARDERARQAQAQQQGQAMLAAAKGAKDLAGASLESDNALNRLFGGMGVAPPAAGGA